MNLITCKKHLATTPPILRIACLCLALSTMTATVFGADYSSGVTAKVLKKTTVTGNDQKIVYPRTDRAEVTAMAVELAPGAETGWHKHPVPVYAYVISGNLTVQLEGGKSLRYRAGDAIVEVVDTWHNGRNNDKEPVRLAVFYLGAEGTPNVVKPAPTEQIK